MTTPTLAPATLPSRSPDSYPSFGGRTLLPVFDRALRTRVRFRLPDAVYDVGAATGDSGEPEFIVAVTDRKLFDRIAGEGSLGLAESYMDGGWAMEKGALEDFLSAVLQARLLKAIHESKTVLWRVAALRLRQRLLGTRHNVRAHYDIGIDLYQAFLDETLGYTCGYQRTPQDDSRTLQENKYDRVCKKIHLQPGQTVLDLGCGFGGFAIHAAKHFGARVTGITNSADHATYGMQRAQKVGVADRVTILSGDFSEAQGRFDRVVSMGMFEHLFRREQDVLFDQYQRCLAPGGFALLHTLGCVSRTNTPDPFIQKYIFPGSRQNPLQRLVDGFERVALPILDVENVGKHYNPTVRCWLDAYRANRHQLDPQRYDARFQRMWELYLAGCIAATLYSDGAVWQVVVTNRYHGRLPLHRIGAA
jgi:cyclopropane-fatty-acyl-phospholipid synthase